MVKLMSQRLVIVAGLLSTTFATGTSTRAVRPERPVELKAPAKDPRVLILKKFFEEHDCPVANLAEDFVAAADRNGLDWRLLPSISFVESTGGKSFRNNNIFGWDNCDVLFPTVRHGIYRVAFHLAEGRYYKGKSLDQKVRTYNKYDFYPGRIKWVMRQLGPKNPGMQHVKFYPPAKDKGVYVN
jgi:hypothetical protein